MACRVDGPRALLKTRAGPPHVGGARGFSERDFRAASSQWAFLWSLICGPADDCWLRSRPEGSSLSSHFFRAESLSSNQCRGAAGRGVMGVTADSSRQSPIQIATSEFPVPELSTRAMMLLGFAGLGFATYRRSRVAGVRSARLRDFPTNLRCRLVRSEPNIDRVQKRAEIGRALSDSAPRLQR
jgi:hypothetical protein